MACGFINTGILERPVRVSGQTRRLANMLLSGALDFMLSQLTSVFAFRLKLHVRKEMDTNEHVHVVRDGVEKGHYKCQEDCFSAMPGD